jgi:hypothetical protein
MNSFRCLLLICCCSANLIAQTNSIPTVRLLFSTPQPELRLSNSESVKQPAPGIPASLPANFILPQLAGNDASAPSLESRSNTYGPKFGSTASAQLQQWHSEDPINKSEIATAVPQDAFEATSPNGGLNGFSLQIYERLEKGGYLTKPELPSEDRLDLLVNSIFVPEPVQFAKVSVTCSIVTAIKRRNPLALLNPIFLDIRW